MAKQINIAHKQEKKKMMKKLETEYTRTLVTFYV